MRPNPGLVAVLVTGAVFCLGLITLVYPGATRMYAWPWSAAYSTSLLLPVLALLLRVFDQRRPMVLPARPWLALALATAGVVLASALASPFRGPALVWSTPLLAGIAVFFLTVHWLHADAGQVAARRERLQEATLVVFAAIACVSLGLWFKVVLRIGVGEAIAGRNIFPLGHPNYTAGIALLILPAAVAMARRRTGRWRATALAVAALALVLLFTSGSRGGMLGLAALAVVALTAAPVSRGQKTLFGVIAMAGALAFALAHPRTRAMFQSSDPGAAPNLSNVQREAMAVAGWRMGADRPLFGWGSGTTPLAFPRYRAAVDGGAENVLQLHSLPVQVWAELGGAGAVCALAFAVLLARTAPRDLVAATTLAGYGAFSLTDWQLDVPIFAGAIAVFAALLAPPGPPEFRSAGFPAVPRSGLPKFRLSVGHVIGGLSIVTLTILALLARRDPAPGLNARALALARDPARTEQAIALFNESLAFNPDQEIAHFNLGWLQVVADPVAAENHFLAAVHLVPDKGGVYFGLGLARLNQGRRDDAGHALAMEALNDPAFLTSPWWREPAIAALRELAAAEFSRLIAKARPGVVAGSWVASQLQWMTARAAQLGHAPPGPERAYRRERTGYPVLMRNLDLPTPVDLFDVRESAAAATTGGDAPPPKGWLPSPLLLSLLDTPPAAPR